MHQNVTVVLPRRAECGEGPYWDPRTSTVVWVDILGKQVMSTDPVTGVTSVINYPQMVGAAAPRAGGGLVLAVESGFALMDSPEYSSPILINCLEPPLRMNDAKVDPGGRYWAGSCAMDFASGAGGLWRLDDSLVPTLELDELTQPNGLGWSPDGTTFYLVETQDRVLLSFEFDPVASRITSAPVELANGFEGYPDGLAVDTSGNLWLAEFGVGRVHEIDPSGTTLRSFDIPTAQPTSCAFVGSRLDRLWVTSAASGLDATVDLKAGNVFEVHGHGARGLPVALFQG